MAASRAGIPRRDQRKPCMGARCPFASPCCTSVRYSRAPEVSSFSVHRKQRVAAAARARPHLAGQRLCLDDPIDLADCRERISRQARGEHHRTVELRPAVREVSKNEMPQHPPPSVWSRPHKAFPGPRRMKLHPTGKNCRRPGAVEAVARCQTSPTFRALPLASHPVEAREIISSGPSMAIRIRFSPNRTRQ